MAGPAATAMRDSARVKAEAEARASWLVVVRSMFIGHPCSETSLALSFKSRNPGRIFAWLLFYHERLRLTTGPGPGLDPVSSWNCFQGIPWRFANMQLFELSYKKLRKGEVLRACHP